MKIRELFLARVTRDIPPVVYFHQQSPEKLQLEVGEYIITGGYEAGDPRRRRVTSGIHEQFVHLLHGIVQELAKKGGPELPASWISGFYGSGKSSFAKLLGLSLDGVVLPDGTALSAALMRRDDAPRRLELVDAWSALAERVDPLAVVFDIGGVARDNEHIHSAVLRLVQARLGYCSKSNLVADYELRLERDGEWNAFVQTARTTLGKEWKDAKEEEQADDHFSHVLHVLKPDRYPDPTSWIDSRAGSRTGAGTSVREVVEAIEAMIDLRAAGKSLFLVVDEVSQYVHQTTIGRFRLSITTDPKPADASDAPSIPAPYFLVLSTIEPRKNHLLLLNIWRRMIETLGPQRTPHLAIVGRRGWENENVVDMLDRCTAIHDHVHEYRGLSDAAIGTLLRRARALLCPSFAEGFGMPVTEALLCGTPVICSDLPALREAGGDVPDFIDPLDGPEWIRAVMDYSTSEGTMRDRQLARLSGWAAPGWNAHIGVLLDLVAEIDAAKGAD